MLLKWSLFGVLPLLCLAAQHPAGGPSAISPLSVQPVVVTPNHDARYLVEEVFIGNGCFSMSNISISGTPGQLGTFSQGGASVGIESGIILSTGNVTDAVGPNSSPSTSTDHGVSFNDPDLVLLSGGVGIFDPVSLEFEFVPSVSQVSFTYVFASEEYCEFAGSPFNDVFGFFLSGPGINGPYSNNAENIAVLPGTTTYVGINTVNHFTNQAFYRNNILPNTPFSCNDDPALFPNLLEYDGLTRVLTAVAEVIPCETYRIKIILADKAEGLYDSAVFLGMSSFEAGTGATLTAGITGNGPDEITAYEGCANGFFRFARQGEDLSQPLPVNFSLHPSSTATPGIDFAPLPTSITIPQGDSVFILPVTIFADGTAEGIETIRIEMQNPCSCQPEYAEIRITDPPPIEIVLTDTLVCAGLPVALTALVAGGIAPLSLLWSTGDTTPVLILTPQAGEVFTLSVSDACGQTAQAVVQIQTFRPSATITGSDYICNGRPEAELSVQFDGPPGEWAFTYTLNNGPANTVSGITGTSYALQVSQPGAYQLTSVQSGACQGTVSGTGTVTEVRVQLQAATTLPSCAGTADAAITLSASGGNAPYQFDWGTGQTITATSTGLPAGSYTVTATDAGGCTADTTIMITDPVPIAAEITVEQPPCNGDPGRIEVWHTGGGEFPLRYSINGGRNFQAIPLFGDVAPGSYAIVVEDNRGCSFTQTVAVIEPPVLQIALPPLVTLRMGERYRILAVPNVDPADIASITWAPPAGLSCTDCLDPELTALRSTSYRLSIVTVQGCTASDSIPIGVDLKVPVFVPNAFSPHPEDGINDRFTVFANAEVVSQVNYLFIFDRWGEKVFEQRDFPPNEVRLGWDGKFRGRTLPQDVYVWWAEVELIDGAVLILKGDVTILR